ncbi:hypothetical protein [Streptomyces sp. NPDC102437]|uniref:hypothetical protein n=1 Tax=Streptomyces sp. NPDC102437 TaxID=3366175 RepID=UPI00381447B1
MSHPRVTVVITHNRNDELLRTLERLAQLPERPPVIGGLPVHDASGGLPYPDLLRK